MEQDWNNNGDAIDAMLQTVGVDPPLPVDDTPTVKGPFIQRDWEPRLTALEDRVTLLEKKKKKKEPPE